MRYSCHNGNSNDLLTFIIFVSLAYVCDINVNIQTDDVRLYAELLGFDVVFPSIMVTLLCDHRRT